MGINDSALALQLKGYRLATAEIVYHLPDHPGLLQMFLWQHLDLAPDYPRLHQFLDYWRQHIEAVLHSVKVARVELIGPPKVKHERGAFLLH
jgi:uncharacterized protein Usg